MNCDFDTDNFICGYTTEFDTDMSYVLTRKKVDKTNSYGEPKKDSHGSEIGYYMVADCRNGYSGDRVFLVSPYFDLDDVSLVSFWTFISSLASDTVSTITVYLLTDIGHEQVFCYSYIA